MEDGHFAIDILDCDPTFIRTVINVQHGTSFGKDYGASLNDKLVESGANPLTVTADHPRTPARTARPQHLARADQPMGNITRWNLLKRRDQPSIKAPLPAIDVRHLFQRRRIR